MSDKFQRSRRLVLLALATLFIASNGQAQGWRNRGGDSGDPPRGREYRPSPRQFADPDRAANAAREATGGRVLGVQGPDRDGQPDYKVRILQPDGRVRNFHYDPKSGRMRN
ncbi:MAG: PepSY domain-containing protein [Candidatus Competibacteraceae bacterium]|nr:PepSY domain-containing protein [Candidatus Competibacteraceae bacterium]